MLYWISGIILFILFVCGVKEMIGENIDVPGNPGSTYDSDFFNDDGTLKNNRKNL